MWLVAGCSLAFGEDAGGLGLIGGLEHLGMHGRTSPAAPSSKSAPAHPSSAP